MMIDLKKQVGSAIVLGLLVTTGSAFTPAEAGTFHVFQNCTNFNQRYPHGVGTRHAHDKTTGTPVTTFRRSNRIYYRAMRHNSDLDRDRDHIACEKA